MIQISLFVKISEIKFYKFILVAKAFVWRASFSKASSWEHHHPRPWPPPGLSR